MNSLINKKIITLNSFLKLKNQNIVFTNGCFDILHFGHIDYLINAKKLGNILVVGLNSDESIRKLKGSTRPVNSVETRSSILASLFFVDYVIIFEESSPIELIEKINPSFLVKGSDYKTSQVVGSKHVLKNGGQVKLLDFVKGFSTSKIIKKIKNEN